MKKPIFMALVGACASGKSTYAKQYADECVLKVFSSDDYREKMFGDRKDQTHNAEIWAQLYKDLRAALEAGETACSVFLPGGFRCFPSFLCRF